MVDAALSPKKVFSPFCTHPLQLRFREGVEFVPLVSAKGLFQVKCRSKDCNGRWVDIDMRGVTNVPVRAFLGRFL